MKKIIYILLAIAGAATLFSATASTKKNPLGKSRINQTQQNNFPVRDTTQRHIGVIDSDEETDRVATIVVKYGDYGKESTTDTIRILFYPDAQLQPSITQMAKLMNNHAYDSILFHRVIDNFMIQTGDPESKRALPGVPLGSGGIEGEGISPMPYVPRQMFAATPRIHKYGAVAVARVGDEYNLKRDGSTSQFYIVSDSTRYTPQQISQMASGRRNNFAQLLQALINNPDSTNRMPFQMAQQLFNTYYPADQTAVPQAVVEIYSNQGGAPYLDEDYTVIGEVIEGMEAVQGIQHLSTDQQNRPTGFAKIVSAKVENVPAIHPEKPKPIRR